jgi:phosphatidylglycerol:prolipoprotein diacylglycerol transferase
VAADPVLALRAGGVELQVYWYGVLVVCGALLTLGVALWRAQQAGGVRPRLFGLWAWTLVACLVGSRTAAVVLGKADSVLGPRGFVSAGGLAVGAAAGWVLCLLWGLPPLVLADVFAPAVAFGEAVARMGTLAAGTGYGVPTDLPWGIAFHSPRAEARPLGVPLHPTQLYLAAGLGTVGWLSARLGDRPGDGRATRTYLFGAGLLRLAVEQVRGDRVHLVPGLSVEEAVAAAFLVTGLLVWAARRSPHVNSRAV